MLRITIRNLLARKLRLLLSGLAVVLGTMFVSGAFVLTDTLGRTFDSVFATAYSSIDVAVRAKPNMQVSELEWENAPTPVSADLVEKIRALPGVASATGVVSVDGARVIGKNGKALTTFGPPQLGGNWVDSDQLVELREGRGPAKDDEIAVNAAVAKAAKIAVGDRVGVLTLEPKREFTVVGIYGYTGGRDSIGGAQEILFTTPVAQRLMLGEPNSYTSIHVQAADGVTPSALRDTITTALGDGYIVKTGKELADETSESFREALEFFNNLLLGFAAVALFVGVFLILNTFSIVVAQRTRELALMRAVGASRRQIVGAVLTEAVIIGVIAAVLGLGAGIGVGALLAYLFSTTSDLQLASVGVPLSAVISSIVVGLLVTIVAALLPALRASRIPPIAAMQDVATPDRPLTRITVTGALVTAVGVTLLGIGLFGDPNDATLWVFLGGVLVSFIGIALLTPLISKPAVALLGRLFSWSVVGKLGRLNSGRNPRRTAITAAALMVGIALVTCVTVIVNSAKRTLTAVVEDNVKADLVISGVQTGARPPTFDPAVLDKAAELPGVAAVTGLYVDYALVDDERTYVYAPSDLAGFREIFELKMATGAVDRLEPHQVLVDDDTARERGLSIGSTVSVQLARGERATYTVAGTYVKSELYDGYMLPPQAAANFSTPQPVQGFLQLAPGSRVDDVQPQVEALLADSPEVSVADRSAFLKEQTSIADRLLVMIQILLALAILIAVLGIINTLALSVIERTRELGLLRAIGLSRAATMRMITVESVVISVFGALLGVIVGAGLGAAMVRALRDQGLRHPVLPWADMAVFIGLAAIVGVIAALLPALRAARLNVLGAIAHE